LDGIVCTDCRGSVPLRGGLNIQNDISRLLNAGTSPSSLETGKQVAHEESAATFCSLCLTVAAKNPAVCETPKPLVFLERKQLTTTKPVSPIFLINKPPQNSLA